MLMFVRYTAFNTVLVLASLVQGESRK